MEKFTDKQIQRIATWLRGWSILSNTSVPMRFIEAFGSDAIKINQKIVYIAHPIAGDVMDNVTKITAIVKDINKNMKDIVPFAPYLADVLALDDNNPEERSIGIRNDVAIIKSGIIDEIWVFGPRLSGGVKAEIELAWDLGIPIKIMDRETVIEPEYQSLVTIGY